MRPNVALRRLSQMGAALESLRQHLNAGERAEMARFLRAEDRDRFALARATLREQAGRALGLAPERVAIVRDAFGKPRLEQAPGLACNVSHSGDWIAVALGRAAEIGVDVEQRRDGPDLDAMARAILTGEERARMSGAASKPEFFYRQWCAKEALVKALGTGLTRDPARFEILFEPDGPLVRFVGVGEDDVGAGWRLESLAVSPGYSGALVWR